MLVEGLLLGLSVLGSFAVIYQRVGRWIAFPLTILIMWHLIVIPICVMYLIGKPVVISLSPLFSSAESRAFRKRLAERPQLSHEEFYSRFFADSGIPSEVPARLRNCLLTLDPLINRAIPDDNLGLLDDELDFVCVLRLIEKEFGIKFAKADYKAVDGTLGNLLRLAWSKIHESPS
jgi:hypothetical protein